MPRWQCLFASVVLVVTIALPSTLVLAPLPPASGTQIVSATPFAGIRGNATSYNWAGYVATGNPGQITWVYGKWRAPPVYCNSTTSYVATWLGIDGYNSSTVEQIGTTAQCSGGVASYYAWWELYPASSVQLITKITVHPHDIFEASVTYSNSTHEFTLRLRDITTRITFVKTASEPGTTESSAEWILEAPSGDNGTASGIYPLAHFNRELFYRCLLTIAGRTSRLQLSSPIISVNMVNYPSGTRTLATTGPILGDGESFHVTWDYGY